MTNKIYLYSAVVVCAAACGLIAAKFKKSAEFEDGDVKSDRGAVRADYVAPRKIHKAKEDKGIIEEQDEGDFLINIPRLNQYCKAPYDHHLRMDIFDGAVQKINALPEEERTGESYLKETHVRAVAELLDLDEEAEKKMYEIITSLVKELYKIESQYIRIERVSSSEFIANLDEVNNRAAPILKKATDEIMSMLDEDQMTVFNLISTWSRFHYGSFLTPKDEPLRQIRFALRKTRRPKIFEFSISSYKARSRRNIEINGGKPDWGKVSSRWQHILDRNELNFK